MHPPPTATAPPLPSGSSPDPLDLLSRADVVLCDLDGCLAVGNRLLPGAVELARRVGDRLFILSNNSTHTPADLAAILAPQGLNVGLDRILLAGTVAVDLVAAEHAGARVMLLGSAGLTDHARAKGLQLTSSDDADIVLLARDLDLSFERLLRATAALHRGARLIVANPDLTHPGPAGVPVPETGALLAALLACAPQAVPRVIGKPEPPMFDFACRQVGAAPSRAVMIGDNPDTDGLGAARAGMPVILLGRRPGCTVPDLAHLLRLHD